MVRPFHATNAFRLLLALCLIPGMQANSRAEDAPPFPTDPGAWINSGPLSVSGLKGKGIVLWFFEEEDAGSRARWQPVLETVEKFKDKPVVFIAVNSGNPRPKLEGYIRQLKVTFPVLVDTSRDFEKACGLIQEVSAQNLTQIRYIKPDGEIQPGLTDDLEESADKAVEGAEWKIDPSTVPDPLKAAWWAVEIGNYKGLAATLKKSSSSSKADVKEAAAKLMEAIQKEMDDLMAKVKEAQEANPYRAFELVTELSDRFNGFEIPKEATTLKKDLSKDPKVKAGQVAAKSLEQARKQMSSGNQNQKTKAKATLEKIIADFPDTYLSQQAKALSEYAE
jgi:peroxiredoxin